MKFFKVFLFLSLFATVITANAQETYFYGRDPIVSSNGKYTAALYKVKLSPYSAEVTIELTVLKKMKRLHYWTSRNTYILSKEEDEQHPIIGFAPKPFPEGSFIVRTEPFSGTWGWSNVKPGEKYYYTMCFYGTIPPGCTDFSLIDPGNGYGAHGFCWRNYTINNPRTEVSTHWTEARIKQFSSAHNDGICGIYEAVDNSGNGYTIGCVKENGEYLLVYLGSKKAFSWWKVGDVKARLKQTATRGAFRANWVMLNKSVNDGAFVFFDKGAGMRTIIDKTEEYYIKMWPRDY